ncbi:MAG: B12-binding domain-containing radical SAM protein [Anaerolineae bacterium]|nr:B12-binding domain-containing radical SAM protein [Anaerolineae bacterium]
MRATVLLYNPVSTSPGKQRLPMSLLALAAMIAEDYDVEIIDGNLIADPAAHIVERARATRARLLGVTVMPGPQLRQAVPVCRQVKAALPDLAIVWGGYFPSNHAEVVIASACVDYVIVGQGETAFRKLVDVLHSGGALDDVPSLVHQRGDTVLVNPRAPFAPLNNLPRYPYDRVHMPDYLGKSYLGQRVGAHHTSWGCPFACNFCAVVPLAKQRWLAESADRVIAVTRFLKERYGVDGMEYHDMDFFVSERRSEAIAEGLIGQEIRWWGLGRVDTLMTYRDATFAKLAKSGVKMIFMGAESGSDETLKLMNKGGSSGTSQTLAIVERMKHYGIVPELSFVLGNPPDPVADIEQTITFIRKVKAINPATELILYLYTPTPQEGSLLLDEAVKLGFRFPQTLEEWAGAAWAEKSLRRNPGTPWSKDPVRRKIRDFETVINAFYPTVTDVRLHGTMRRLLQALSGWRYRLAFYSRPYELKLLQRMVQYRRPETMGF